MFCAVFNKLAEGKSWLKKRFQRLICAVPTYTTSDGLSWKLADSAKAVGESLSKVKMVVTAYSSTPDQTDSTPFITASGKHVEDGIIANNMLPFGTKIRMPELYGDKIFVVEDRMHKRKGLYQADIWFESRAQAKEFGAKTVNIEVIES